MNTEEEKRLAQKLFAEYMGYTKGDELTELDSEEILQLFKSKDAEISSLKERIAQLEANQALAHGVVKALRYGIFHDTETVNQLMNKALILLSPGALLDKPTP